MVIDTSALIAILLHEPDAAPLARTIAAAPKRLLGALSLLEAGIVIEAKKGEEGARQLDLLIHRAGIEVIAMNDEQAELARIAWRRYGKGRHPARLNLGDCCAYALSRHSGEPLLFKGDDFPHTDVQAVAWHTDDAAH
ncbi:type II toxin-antitoxin system VapC family toxin [Endothiovibrio diazotrophicus]